jgi:hypothetical protein
MLTGEIRNQVDQIWNAYCMGFVSKVAPLSENAARPSHIKHSLELVSAKDKECSSLEISNDREAYGWDI